MALADNIVHYWSFDSSNSNDEVGSRNGTDTDITYSSGNGKIDIGAGFNGSTSKINFSSATMGFANAWTINWWQRADAFTGNPRVIFIGPDGGANSIVCLNATSGAINASFTDSGGSEIKSYTTNNTFSTGTYYMQTLTWDGTTFKIYVDATDQAVTKNTDNSGTMTDTSRSFNFSGNPGGAALFDGSLDEIGFWSRALSSTEVSELYNGGAGNQYPFAASGTTTVNRGLSLLGVGQ